jgi:hypothetical protein
VTDAQDPTSPTDARDSTSPTDVQAPVSPPFRVEVAIDAPREAVWRALTDEREMRRWFGWDYDGLEAEIRVIFTDYAKVVGDRILIEPDQTIAVEGDEARAVVRIWSASADDDTGWDEVYDEVVQGWRVFLQQLRHSLEVRPGTDRRRTLHATGQVVPAEAFAALAEAAPGRPWDATRFQRSVAVDRWGGGLVGLLASTPAAGTEPATGQLTVTTYGLDEASFAEVLAEWTAWWKGVAKEGQITF